MCKCYEHKESDFNSVLVEKRSILMKSIPHNDLRTYERESLTALIKIMLVAVARVVILRKKLENLMKRNDLNKKSSRLQISLV